MAFANTVTGANTCTEVSRNTETDKIPEATASNPTVQETHLSKTKK